MSWSEDYDHDYDEDDDAEEVKVTGVERTTEKAVLFKSQKGKFWAPRSQLVGAWRDDADKGFIFVKAWFHEKIEYL